MKHLNLRMYAMVFALVCVWVIFTLLTGGTFLSTRNLSNLSRQAAVTAILAVGMTLVIVSANIDLSVGYGAGLLGAVAAIVHVRWEQPIVLTLFVVICIGVLMGLIQGYLVAYQRIPRVHCHIGWIFGISWVNVSVYQGRNHPATRQLAQSDRECLPFTDTRLGTCDFGTLHKWCLLLPTAHPTATIWH